MYYKRNIQPWLNIKHILYIKAQSLQKMCNILGSFDMWLNCQLVRWCWSLLEKNNRTPLPACAMSRIGNAFPANDGQYKNFEWPNN